MLKEFKREAFASFSPFIPYIIPHVREKLCCVSHRRQVRVGRSQIGSNEEVSVKVNEASGRLMRSL